MSRLKEMISGVSWGGASVITMTLCQLVFMAVMARLLEPADFGLVAIANVALRFYSYFAQMGVGPALIQKQTLDAGDIGAALTLSLSVSGAFFLVAAVTAGPVERFFDMESLAPVMRALALNFIISGFSAISQGLLRRERKFKKIAIIEITSYVIGYGVVGILTAYRGMGVWSLVLAFLSQMIISSILSYIAASFTVSFKHNREQRRHFIGYGGKYSIIGFIEFLTSNADSLLVGKVMGASAAGYYNRSMLLANLPVQQPTRVITQTLFPIMSTMNEETEKHSYSVQISILLVGSYAFSVGLGVSIAAPEIVNVLLGSKWRESIQVLQILALAAGPIYTSNVIGVALDSIGALLEKLRIQFTAFVFLLASLMYVSTSGDIRLVAWSIVFTYFFRLIMMSWIAVKMLSISVSTLVKICGVVVLTMSATSLSVLATSEFLTRLDMLTVRLVVEVISGGIGFLIGIYFSRLLAKDVPAVIYICNRSPRISRLMRF